MKITDMFEVFQGLPALDDTDLARWVTRSCAKRDVANYEDALLDVVRVWLHALTGVSFVRAYEHGDRDEVVNGSKDGQYGTVHLLRAEATRYADKMVMSQNEGGDFCQISATPLRFVFRVEVFREAGQANNQQAHDVVQTPMGSAPDPFLHAIPRLRLTIFKQALAEYCLQLEDEPMRLLTNIPEMVNSRYERRAMAELSIVGHVSGSIRVPGANAVEWGFCDDSVNEIIQ